MAARALASPDFEGDRLYMLLGNANVKPVPNRDYRTIDKSEVDLVLDGTCGPIPIEIKLSSSINQRTLRGLKKFMADTGADFGVLVNRGRRVELLTENIIQLPVNYL